MSKTAASYRQSCGPPYLRADVRNLPARLDPQPWMTEPAVSRLLRALTSGGVEARFVGGCVRNALLRLPVADVDLATPAQPDETTRVLQAAGVRVLPTGVKHGTVTAIVDGKSFEITTLRRDVETDGRHAVVAYTHDWAEDAARRDFTMNAIFCSPDGTLFDPVGGLPDLAARRVRFVGEARQRIREDVLRLLRYFRFYAHYGAPPPDAQALEACHELASLLPRLSGERVREELAKLLLAPTAAEVWRLMLEEGIVVHLIPAADDAMRLGKLVELEQAFGLADWLRRLAALLPRGREIALSGAEQLRLSNEQRDRLAAMLDPAMPVEPSISGPDLRRAFYRLGSDLTLDLALLRAAERGDAAEKLEPLIHAGANWIRPRFPVSGADILALGVPPGRRVGELLGDVEAWWIERDFAPDRQECLEEMRIKAAAQPP